MLKIVDRRLRIDALHPHCNQLSIINPCNASENEWSAHAILTPWICRGETYAHLMNSDKVEAFKTPSAISTAHPKRNIDCAMRRSNRSIVGLSNRGLTTHSPFCFVLGELDDSAIAHRIPAIPDNDRDNRAATEILLKIKTDMLRRFGSS